MLSGIRIYTSDTLWRQILTDLNAVVLDVPNFIDPNLDDLNVLPKISIMDLKALILDASDIRHTLRNVFHKDVILPQIQAQIVAVLYKSGGMTALELKSELGYAPDVATHTIDTAIYQLRQKYGHEFIKNINGEYKLGKL